MFECYEDVQGEKALTHMPGTMGKAQQAAVVLVECKSRLFHQWIPSAVELEHVPGCVFVAGGDFGLQQMVKIQMLVK